MTHVYVGIDPGKEGAVARLHVDRPSEILLADTPMLRAGVKSVYDEQAMASLLRQVTTVADGIRVLVVLEKVHSMPKQSSQSGFTFGVGFGLWRGMCSMARIPYVLVDPRTWGKVSLKDVARGDVAAAAAAAARLYPAASDRLRTPRGRVLDGRTDALLLAHYGRVSGL